MVRGEAGRGSERGGGLAGRINGWPVLIALAFAAQLSAQTISVDKQSLTFAAQLNGSPVTQLLNVTGSSDPSVPATFVTTVVKQSAPSVNWLSVNPSGGATPASINVTVDPGTLPPGTYTGSVVFSVLPPGSGSVTVSITASINTIYAFPTSLTFTSVANTSPKPGLQSITLQSSQPISYSVTAFTLTGGSWLQVTPSNGFVSAGFPAAVTAILDSSVVPTLSPGQYSGTITVTPTSGPSTVPVQVPVSLTVLPAPPVTVNPTALSLNYQIGGTTNVIQKTAQMSTTANSSVDFTVTAASDTNPYGTWVLTAPLSGTMTSAGTPLNIAYNTGANLAEGIWKSTVTVNTPGGTPQKTVIPVTLQVSKLPLLNVPTDTLTFSYELGGANPAPQPVTVTATSGSVGFLVTLKTDTGNWLSAPSTGTSGTPFNITVNPAGLAPGTYAGTVFVTGTGSGNGAQPIPISLKVSNDPFLVSSVSTLNYAYQVTQIPTATNQTVTLSSSNGVPLAYTATAASTTCGGSWLQASGTTTGTTNNSFTVSVTNLGLLNAGVCLGAVTIRATNPLTATEAVNSPVTIPVKLVVSNSAELIVSPQSPVTLSAPLGGPSQSVVYTVSSTSNTDQLTFTVKTATVNGGTGWLVVSAANGQTVQGLNKVTISAQAGQLAAGTYTGTVTLTATGPNNAAVDNSPYVIPVTLTVTQGALTLGQTSLAFKQPVGGAAPASQNMAVTSTGAPLNFTGSAYTSGTVPWLTVSQSGSTPGTVTVSVDGSKLAMGNYTGTVTVISTTPFAANSPTSFTVTLHVNAGTISSSPVGLTFTQVQGGPAPPAQSLGVAGAPSSIAYSASATPGTAGMSLSVTPSTGSTPGTVQVTADAGSLQAGTYKGTVTISANDADGSPLPVPVTLNVLPSRPLSVSATVVSFTAAVGATSQQTQKVVLASAGGTVAYTVTLFGGGPWLNVSPLSGTTPDSLVITVDPTGLGTGLYSATLTATSPNSVPAPVITVSLAVGSVTKPVLNAVANAANYLTGAVAPGENVVLFGSGMGPDILKKGTVTAGVVDTTVSGTRILFDGIPAPLIYVSALQSSAMVPYGVAGRSITNVVVEYLGVQSAAVAYNVTSASPGMYTQNAQGNGPGGIINADYSINLAGSPAPRGSYVAVYMTGEGFTSGAVDGALATALLSPVLPVTATVGGIPATVYYAGTAPGIVTGVMQVDVLIPLNVTPGPAVPIVVTVGSPPGAFSTQAGVTVAVK